MRVANSLWRLRTILPLSSTLSALLPVIVAAAPFETVCLKEKAGKRMAASAVAVHRLRKDFLDICRNPRERLEAKPLESNILEWHFVIHGAPGSPYEGGCYYGKMVLPPDFPFAPPSLIMMTPSGRFKPEERLCTTMTDFHPENWSAVWSVGSILTGLQSFMLEEHPSAVGSIQSSVEERRRLARASWSFNWKIPRFQEMFPHLQFPPRRPAVASASSSSSPAEADGTGVPVVRRRGSPAVGSSYHHHPTDADGVGRGSFKRLVTFCLTCFAVIWLSLYI